MKYVLLLFLLVPCYSASAHVAPPDSLYERLLGEDAALHTKLPAHDLAAFMRIWLTDAEGLGSAAATRVVNSLRLTAQDQVEAQLIKDKYDALTGGANAEARVQFLDRLESVFILIESGHLAKSEAQSLLGL